MKDDRSWGTFFFPLSFLSMAKKYWLMKSEPNECSVQSVLSMPEQTVDWFGIRNYQARNFMRDDMQVDDTVFFYHSSCKHPGIVGLARVASKAHPDQTQFDPNNEYFDPKSTEDKPRWVCVDIQVLQELPRVGLDQLRAHEELQQMRVLQRGNRLSITPVTEQEFEFIMKTFYRK